MPRILLHNSETDSRIAPLRARFPQAEVQGCTTYAALPEMVERFRPDVVYAVRFAGTPGYPRDALFGADGPRWVANGGAGTDHFGTWDPGQTTVTNAAGVAADMMAEYIIGGFLHFTLDIPGQQHDKAARVRNSARLVTPPDKEIDKLVDLIMTSSNGTARIRFESKIAEFEMNKALMTGKAAQHTEPQGSFDENLEPALTFLANPWKLWQIGCKNVRREVAKLAFNDSLKYDRNHGARNPDLAFLFKALRVISDP